LRILLGPQCCRRQIDRRRNKYHEHRRHEPDREHPPVSIT
jgi:hypothetical protein